MTLVAIATSLLSVLAIEWMNDDIRHIGSQRSTAGQRHRRKQDKHANE